MLYVYAIADHSSPELSLLAGMRASLFLEVWGNLAAVCARDLEIADLEEDNGKLLQAIIDHDRIVRQLFAKTAVLPLRFGTYFRSVASLRSHLTKNTNTYTGRLQALRNRAEFSLKLWPLEASEAATRNSVDAPATTGERTYFLSDERRGPQSQTFASQQHREKERLLATIAAECEAICHLDPDEEGNERLCFLDNRWGIERDRWDAWRAIAPAWQLQCSEALPPYHFVEADA